MIQPRKAFDLVFFAFLVIGLSGCGSNPAAVSTPPAPRAAAATSTTPSPAVLQPPTLVPASPTPGYTPTPTLPPLPDLNTRPLVWFGPLPPLPTGPGRPFIGSDDFMDLFTQEAGWDHAAGFIHVFKLYGEWVAYHATDSELRQAVASIRRRGMALAVEVGPLTITEGCGAGIEGFAGIEEGLRIARRIQRAGGTIQLVAFDHPYDAGTLDTSANACRWTPEKTASNVAQFVQSFRTVFPRAAFGDIITAKLDAREIERWVSAYRAQSREDLAFVHLDIDFSLPNWARSAHQVEDMLRSHGIPFGIIYFGSWNDRSDRDWLANAGERVKTYELKEGGHPDHVIFQSWHDHPDRVLPESDPDTYTGWVNRYFKDKNTLGVQSRGPGANLAYGKTVRVSRASAENPAARAVDGNPDTWWGSGDFPPQWIEIDLGEDANVAAIQLTIGQSPAGQTTHRVLVMGTGTGGKYQVIHTFTGQTADMDILTVPLPTPLKGVRTIRVETKTSPSWVAWREIQVIAAD